MQGQLSPQVARALKQWENLGYDSVNRGFVEDAQAVNVLPPELQRQFDNLRKPPAPESQQAILDHSRYGFFNNLALNVGLASQLILRQPTSQRIFFFVVNTHALQLLFLRFGADSNTTIGIPIQPNFGFIGFDTVVPQDDIFMIANGAATTGVALYSNKDQ